MSRLPSLGPRGVGWVLIQGVLLVVVVAAGTLPPAWAGLPRLVTSIGGIMGIAMGLGLAVRGVRDLRASFTPLPYPRPDGDLVTDGVYGLVRHPVYGGLVLAAIGWSLLTASPIALAAAAVLWGFFELKSRREEAWLVARYPGYADYRMRTRRFIPWLG